MKKRTYRTITGRNLSLSRLTKDEKRFLAAVRKRYSRSVGWSKFGAWWPATLLAAGLVPSSTCYRICQDLEARLGIVEGKVAPPDYRDYLADLIEERYGSRYRFCKETGIDPGHLSRIFASRSELSLQNLQKILKALGATMVVQSSDDVAERVSPGEAAKALATAG